MWQLLRQWLAMRYAHQIIKGPRSDRLRKCQDGPVTDAAPEQPHTRLLPDRHGLVVRLEAHPGARAVVLDALHRYADRLDEEPATEFFVISLDPDEVEVVWLHEWFHEQAGLDAHRAAPAFTQLMSELSSALVSPPGVMRFQPLRMHLATQLLADESL